MSSLHPNPHATLVQKHQLLGGGAFQPAGEAAPLATHVVAFLLGWDEGLFLRVNPIRLSVVHSTGTLTGSRKRRRISSSVRSGSFVTNSQIRSMCLSVSLGRRPRRYATAPIDPRSRRKRSSFQIHALLTPNTSAN